MRQGMRKMLLECRIDVDLRELKDALQRGCRVRNEIPVAERDPSFWIQRFKVFQDDSVRALPLERGNLLQRSSAALHVVRRQQQGPGALETIHFLVGPELPRPPGLQDAANVFPRIPPQEYESRAREDAVEKRDAERIFRCLFYEDPIAFSLHRVSGLVHQTRGDLMDDAIAVFLDGMRRRQPVGVDPRCARPELTVIFHKPVRFASEAAHTTALNERFKEQDAARTRRSDDENGADERSRRSGPRVGETTSFQELNQGSSVRKVVAPSPDEGLIQGLANLPATRRLNGAFRLVEIQAGWVPIESAVVDECATSRLRFGDQCLIADLVDRDGKNGAPVCHQPLVLQKIVSEVLECRGVVMLEVKQLHKTGHANIERISTAVDDARLGKKSCNQTEMQRVERHLVGHSKRLGPGESVYDP